MFSQKLFLSAVGCGSRFALSFSLMTRRLRRL